MDKKALYNLTYGVFMLSTKVNDKENGCIINTCMQVANDPVRIAISVLKIFNQTQYESLICENMDTEIRMSKEMFNQSERNIAEIWNTYFRIEPRYIIVKSCYVSGQYGILKRTY